MRQAMRVAGFAAFAMAAAFLAPEYAHAQTAEHDACLSGGAAAQQEERCSHTWSTDDATGYGSASATAQAEAHSYATSAASTPAETHDGYDYYSTAPVVEEGDLYGAGPVVVTRGRYGRSRRGGYRGGYDVYVPLHAGYGTACEARRHEPGTRRCAPVLPPAPCAHDCAGMSASRCFRRDARGRTTPIPCPAGRPAPAQHGHSTAHTTSHSSASASATANATASASVNISNAGFFNSLTGGVGGPVASFYGGGATFITGGHASVLSRAPLLRFRHRTRGHGHMCGCGGGMGGGD